MKPEHEKDDKVIDELSKRKGVIVGIFNKNDIYRYLIRYDDDNSVSDWILEKHIKKRFW